MRIYKIASNSWIDKGVYYRGGPTSQMERNKTAEDIIRYETEELGNRDIVLLPNISMKDIRAEHLVWLTTSKKKAADYGSPHLVLLGKHRIIAKDSDGGFLIEVAK